MSLEEVMVDYVLPASYLLVILAIFLALVFGVVMSALSNPQGMVKGLIAIVLLGVVFAIGYSIAGNEVKPVYANFGVTTADQSQMVGAGLMTFYILFAIAAVGIVFTEISKVFK